MAKHIIGQAVFQLSVLIVFVFFGELFIPEYADSYDSTIFVGKLANKWHNGVVGGTIRSGRLNTISGGDDYNSILEETGVYSRHFTMVFNVFVMMQIFNFLNCRKIHEEINILSNISKNKVFLLVVGIILVLQVVLVTFGSEGFFVYANFGLVPQQWLICIGVGSLAIPINFLLKQVPCASNKIAEDLFAK